MPPRETTSPIPAGLTIPVMYSCILSQLTLTGTGGPHGTEPCNIELVLTLDQKYPSSKIGVTVNPRDGVSGADAGTLQDQLNRLAKDSVSVVPPPKKSPKITITQAIAFTDASRCPAGHKRPHPLARA